jgi:hypothetical protein
MAIVAGSIEPIRRVYGFQFLAGLGRHLIPEPELELYGERRVTRPSGYGSVHLVICTSAVWPRGLPGRSALFGRLKLSDYSHDRRKLLLPSVRLAGKERVGRPVLWEATAF